MIKFKEVYNGNYYNCSYWVRQNIIWLKHINVDENTAKYLYNTRIIRFLNKRYIKEAFDNTET